MTTANNINFSINLNGLKFDLLVELEKIIKLVAAGLSLSESVDPDRLSLPGHIRSSFSSVPFEREEFFRTYYEWILANGFRDAIEAVNSFLESAYRVLSIWDLVERQDSGKPVAMEETIDLLVGGSGKFHRLGLPDKLQTLKKDYCINLDHDTVEQVLSINAARNCLVHRKGVVGKRDVDADGRLAVKWRSFHFFLKNEDGVQEIAFGEPMEKESTLCMRVIVNEKMFQLGEGVAFDVSEVSEILWCLSLFAEDVFKVVHQCGIDRGHIQEQYSKTL